MNEDYLWNKTGADAEIERLENQLRTFRYRETAPPALPIKAPFRSARKNYRSLYAIAACAMVAMILLGAWLQLSISRTGIKTESAEIILLENDLSNSTGLVMPDSPDVTTKKATSSKQLPKPKALSSRKSFAVIASPLKTMANIRRTDRQKSVTLTKEEKFAYDQLILALSITSSKLKMVKDKVAGLEDSQAVYENGGKFLRR